MPNAIGEDYQGIVVDHFVVNDIRVINKHLTNRAFEFDVLHKQNYLDSDIEVAAIELAAKVMNTKTVKHITEKERQLYIYHDLLLNNQEALDYLYSRGFTLEYIKSKQIGYAPMSRKTLSLYPHVKENQLILQELMNNYGDFFHNRIIFPIYNQNG